MCKLHSSAVLLPAVQAAREISNVEWEQLKSPSSAGETGFIAVFRACLRPFADYLNDPKSSLQSSITGRDFLWDMRIGSSDQRTLRESTLRVVNDALQADECELLRKIEEWRGLATAAAKRSTWPEVCHCKCCRRMAVRALLAFLREQVCQCLPSRLYSTYG